MIKLNQQHRKAMKMPAGRPKGTTGTVFTTEHRQKIADGNRGKAFTPERCQRISDGNKAYQEKVRTALKFAEEAGIIPENS